MRREACHKDMRKGYMQLLLWALGLTSGAQRSWFVTWEWGRRECDLLLLEWDGLHGKFLSIVHLP